MGNCVICKNSKKIKQKAKYQYNKHHYHHYHIRRDNGDILNHIEQISPLNISSNHNEKFIFPSAIETPVERIKIDDNVLLETKAVATPINNDDNDSVFCSDNPLWKKDYRSLQKSKKSIKKLEETLKNSSSIENWLNQVTVNETQVFLSQTRQINDNDDSSIKTTPTFSSSTASPSSPSDSLNELDVANFEYLKEHYSLANDLYELNSKCSHNELETKYKQFIKSFFIPRSLSYSQDIQLLKWLINNFTLSLYQPISQQKFYSNHDKLTRIQKRLYLFLLQPLDLSIESFERNDSNKPNNSDLVYEYYQELNQIRGQLSMNDDDSSARINEENNENVKSKKQFLFNFLKTSNSISTTSLINSKLKLAMSPITTSTKSFSPVDTSKSHLLSYYDLIERLFTCFLSNFSCQLAENFIKSLHEYHVSYIRKSNLNDYFSYIEISKEQQVQHSFDHDSHKQTLNVDEYRFKLCLKLNQWPIYYQKEYFNRQDRLEWPSKNQLMKLNKEMCFLVNELPNLSDITLNNNNENDDTMSLYYWTIDYSQAETHLFRNCLNKKQKFYYYLFYYILRDLIFNDAEHLLDNCVKSESITEPLKYINYERLFMHHYFRFLELFSVDMLHLNSVCLVRKFIHYLTITTLDGSSINKGNYFYHELCIEHNFSSRHDELICINLSNLYKLIETTQVQSFTNVDTFINYLKFNFNFNCQNENIMLSSVHNWSFYSSYSYIYEYIYDYTCYLYQQFYLKRDNLKISEELLITIHNEIVKNSTIFSQIDANHNDYCYLLNQYEVYAEYVNKYLSQIRNYNQYLLFHYIWTMQVQYLTPFFNYIIDKYKIF